RRRRSHAQALEPAHAQQSQHQREDKHKDARRLQQQVAHHGAKQPDPVLHPAAGRAGGVQRRVKRRVAGQRQEKEGRRDQQKEADQLIEPAVPGRRERTQKILHWGLSFGLETALQPAKAALLPAKTALPAKSPEYTRARSL